MKDISNQYQHLTADERFRLFVAAMGRKDEQELDQLENTCARKAYTQQDWDYTNRKMTFMVYALCSALERLRADLLAMTAMGLHFAVFDDEDHPEKAEGIMTAFTRLMQVQRARKTGWSRFCEGLGVDATAIARPFLDHVDFAENVLESAYEMVLSDSDDPASDEAKIAEAEVKALDDAWFSKVGR